MIDGKRNPIVFFLAVLGLAVCGPDGQARDAEIQDGGRNLSLEEAVDRCSVLGSALDNYPEGPDPDELGEQRARQLSVLLAACSKAVQTGDPLLQYYFGAALIDSRQFDEGLSWMTKAADQDYGRALNVLARANTFWSNDFGISGDKSKAISLADEACDLGDRVACMELGYTFFWAWKRGYFSEDEADVLTPELRRSALARASELGSANASNMLILMYATGEDSLLQVPVKKDQAKLDYYENKAFEQNHPRVVCGRSSDYMAESKYDPGHPSWQKGVDLMKRAAELGSVICASRLGRLLRTGTGGFEKDLKQAAHWYCLGGPEAYRQATTSLFTFDVDCDALTITEHRRGED